MGLPMRSDTMLKNYASRSGALPRRDHTTTSAFMHTVIHSSWGILFRRQGKGSRGLAAEIRETTASKMSRVRDPNS